MSTPSLQQELESALAAFQTGALDIAAAGCKRVLKRHPREPGALHLMGVIELKGGHAKDAIRYLKPAAKADSGNAELLTHLGAAYRAGGKPSLAEKSYRRALKLNPDVAGAYNNLGVVLAEKGDTDAAIDAYGRALARRPDDRTARTNLAHLCLGSGRAADAADHFRLLLNTNTADTAAAYAGLGLALVQTGDTDGAITAFEQALAAQPAHTNSDAEINLANALCLADRHGEAAVIYQRVLAAEPGSIDAMLGLGNVHEEQEQPIEAEALVRKALSINPDFAEAHNNLGNLLTKSGQRDEALGEFDTALKLNPAYADAHANAGHALLGLDRAADAITRFDQALAINENHWDAAFSRAQTQLSLGRFTDGWRSYCVRDTVKTAGIALTRVPFAGDLSGQHILLLAEQGIGDELFFLRFVPELKARGAHITYRPTPKLIPFARQLDFIDTVSTTDEIPEADLVASIGDLPYLTGMTDGAAPPAPVQLAATDDRLAGVSARLTAAGPPPYLGVTWRGGTKGNRHGLFKEAPLGDIAGALSDWPGTILALQRLPEDGEVSSFAAASGRPTADFSDFNGDLEDMLALLKCLDGYVAVSNTNIHLAAGIGLSCRILVPNPPEFRWMAASVAATGSPWFPGMTLYRQDTDGEWPAALSRLAVDIADDTAREPTDV